MPRKRNRPNLDVCAQAGLTAGKRGIISGMAYSLQKRLRLTGCDDASEGGTGLHRKRVLYLFV